MSYIMSRLLTGSSSLVTRELYTVLHTRLIVAPREIVHPS